MLVKHSDDPGRPMRCCPAIAAALLPRRENRIVTLDTHDVVLLRCTTRLDIIITGLICSKKNRSSQRRGGVALRSYDHVDVIRTTHSSRGHLLNASHRSRHNLRPIANTRRIIRRQPHVTIPKPRLTDHDQSNVEDERADNGQLHKRQKLFFDAYDPRLTNECKPKDLYGFGSALRSTCKLDFTESMVLMHWS
jgi:hypothetical protein